MVLSDLNDLNEVLSSEKVQVTAFIQTDEQLGEGYGVPMFPFNVGGDDDLGGSKVGARRRSPEPSGETSIALQLPKRNEEVDSLNDSSS